MTAYSIYFMETEDAWYVGSAWNKTTPQHRYQRHYSGRGGAPKLWEAIQAGAQFTQRVLELGDGETVANAYEAEERWIHKFLADDPRECLNVNLYPSKRRGWAESPESIARRAEKARGKPNEANRERLTGKPRPDLVDAWARPGAKEERTAATKAGLAAMSPEAKAAHRKKISESRKRKPKNTHCRHGHEYTPENTYIVPTTGHRQCRECQSINRAKRKTDTESASN